MSRQYHIKINGELIPVSETVYRAYQRPKWRERKQKVVRNDMERSYDVMLESGLDIKTDLTQPCIDEIIEEKLLFEALLEAIAALDDDERNLIFALFYKGKSERAYSKETSIPRKTLAYRRMKVLEKLRNIIKKS